MRHLSVGWALVALLGFGKTLAAEPAPDLTVGIVSDIHLSRPAQHKSQGAIDAFLRALGFFKENSVDAIVIAGDLTNGGTADELKITAECWEQVFGSLTSGPVKVFVTGNHENNYSKEAKERWHEILQEPDTPFFIKRVKGYAFVGAHWAAWNNEKVFRAFLQEHSADIAGVRPFFYIQHAHPQHTCYGDWIWHRPDGGPTDKVLADYPNAVAFSGHTHYSLTDERSIWQGAFTSIGTASLRWLSLPDGRENGTGLKQVGHRMSDIASDYGPSQGLVMRVRGDRMVFERYDLSKMERLGPDWDVRTLRSAGDPRPYGFVERRASLKAPEFPEGAKVTVSVVSGRSPKKTPERQVVLKFPAATAEDASSRVYDYEVTAELVAGDCVLPWRTKRVFQPGLPLSVERQAATAACVYGLDELPPPPFRFAVTPMNAFGNRGKTIYLPVDKKAAEAWSACGKTSRIAPRPQTEKWWMPRHEEKLRLIREQKGGVFDIVLLGDSISHGWETAGANVLKELCATHSVLDIGFSGDRTYNALWRVKNGELDGYRAKLVTLLIGTNNWEENEPSETAADIRELVGIIRAKQPDAKILLMPIFPRRGKRADYKNGKNTAINREIESLADGKTIVWFDLREKFAGAPPELFPDGLHPNEAGYRIWLKALEPYLPR